MATQSTARWLILMALLGPGIAAGHDFDFWVGRHTITGTWTDLSGVQGAVTASSEAGFVALEGSAQGIFDEHMAGTRGGLGFATWTRITPDIGDGFHGYFRGDGRDGSVTLARGASTGNIRFTAVPLSRPDGGLERVEIIDATDNGFTMLQLHSSDGGTNWQEVGRLQYTRAANNSPAVNDPGLPVCGSVLHQQMNPWAGNYELTPPAGTTSRVALRMGNCAHIESMDFGSTAGGGISMSDQRSGQIMRLYVDADGTRFFHAGSRTPPTAASGEIVLTGGNDGVVISSRVTWILTNQSFSKMIEEVTLDGGTTWEAGSYDRNMNRPSSTVGSPAGGPHPGFNFGGGGDAAGQSSGGGAMAPLALLGLGLLGLGLARRRRG